MTHLISRLTCTLAIMLFFLAAAPVAAQNGTISGTITIEDDGAVLPGANVVALSDDGSIVGGAATNIDGEYSFSVAAGAYTVRARYVGFQDCEADVTVSAGGSTTFDCALSQTGLELNTVVVAASRRQEKALMPRLRFRSFRPGISRAALAARRWKRFALPPAWTCSRRAWIGAKWFCAGSTTLSVGRHS